MNNLLHAMRALNPRDARKGPDPADAKDDTRREWSKLDTSEKAAEVLDYLKQMPAAEMRTLILDGLRCDCLYDYIGHRIVRENESEWVW